MCRRPSAVRLQGQPPLDLHAPLFESAAQDLGRVSGAVGVVRQGGEGVGQPAAVDDRTGIVDAATHPERSAEIRFSA